MQIKLSQVFIDKLNKAAYDISLWNRVRYEDNSINTDLFYNLVKEEINEYYAAKTLVEKVDAICDVMFIVIGAHSKLNTGRIDFTKLNYTGGNMFLSLSRSAETDLTADMLLDLLSECFATAEVNGVKPFLLVSCLDHVVFSNNTKSVNKIAAGEKYSSKGKGPNYIAPTKPLEKELYEAGLIDKPREVIKPVLSKFDDDKLQYVLIPSNVTKALASVLTFGARKYGINNWKNANVEDGSRYLDAMFRHIEAYRDGELNDKESGYSHLWHALTNVVFLVWFELKFGAKKLNKVLRG